MLVSQIENVEARQRSLEYERVILCARALAIAVETPQRSSPDIEYRSLRAELATALHVSEYAIDRELDLAFTLTHQYPAALAALEVGAISTAHARVISDAGVTIGPGAAERCAAYEAAVLRYAVEETPTRLRPIAKRLAESYAEVSLEERHEEARKLRRVVVIDCEDGMADLYAHIPAVTAYAIRDRLTGFAKCVSRAEAPAAAAGSKGFPIAQIGAAAHPGSDAKIGGAGAGAGAEASSHTPARTYDELRADFLTELLLTNNVHEGDEGVERHNSDGLPFSSVKAHIQVIIPVSVLDDQASSQTGTRASTWTGTPTSTRAARVPFTPHEVCELVGYGPVAPSAARALAAEKSTWNLVSTDPRLGLVTRVDRYRPSKEMRRILRARDVHCRFPGCQAPIARCDLDHTLDWELGGATSTDNLEHLCRGHHVLKHNSGWSVTQDSTGTLRWRSPTGRVHVERPPGQVRFIPAA